MFFGRKLQDLSRKQKKSFSLLILREIAHIFFFFVLFLNECLPKDWRTTKIGDVRVFWAMGQSAESYQDYRGSQDSSSRRAIDEIPPEELANAMLEVLMDFNSCQQDTLYRETVKLFGFSTVTAKARKYLDFGMEALKKSGRIFK